MKGKLTTIIAGTMLVLTSATLPASAIVSNAVSQQTTYENQTPPTYGSPPPLPPYRNPKPSK
jgi:hypothetical protein